MTPEAARRLDAADPLAFTRERFDLPPGIIYLDGNSLGALPVATFGALRQTVKRQWGEDLIASWNKHGWIDAPEAVAAKLAPLLGARVHELLIADSTSVNLFKLLAAGIRARPGRPVILSHEGNFPTDLYVAQGLADLLPDLEIRAVPSDKLADALDQRTAVVMATHVDYRSGATLDMAALNAAARTAGALNLWDLSHSAGALALDLNASGCDLAVGCGYKYLNGGPGAPAFLFVAEQLQAELQSPLSGWMGHADPFAFDHGYQPTAGIRRFLTGTPPILALAALAAGIATFEGTSLQALEAKSRALSELFVAEVEERCGDELRLVSPRDPAARGSHVSFAHPHAYPVMQALIAHGVIGDVRAPDLLRFGFAPLYNSFADVVRAAEVLSQVLAGGEWDQPRFRERRRVT